MRRRRRMSSHTGTKRKSHKKILIRIAFTVLTAAVLTSLAMMLGHRLDRKAAEAALRTESVDDGSSAPAETEAETEAYPDGIKSTSDASSLKITAADIDVRSVLSDEIGELMDSLSPEYNAVSVRVTDGGRLVYLSPALLSLSHLPEDSSYTVAHPDDEDDENDENDDDGNGSGGAAAASDPLENIKKVIEEAGSRSLRTSAVYSVTEASLDGGFEASLGRAVVGELCSFGFDEVIVDGLFSDGDISERRVEQTVLFLSSLRDVSGEVDIGITLPASVYLDTTTASSIKTLSEYADLLAINISSGAENAADAYKAVYDGCYSLKGNFSVYNIRGMITDTTPECAEAAYAALKALADASVQFSVFVDEPSYEPEAPETDDGGDTDSKSNPYAMTGGAYSDESDESDELGDGTD